MAGAAGLVEAGADDDPYRARAVARVVGESHRSGATLANQSSVRVSMRGRRTEHGHGNGTQTYKSWQGMWQRCTNPRHGHWLRYGGRGIGVDPAWRDFKVFLSDMGPRPAALTLDRVDNNKGYSKANCRWATSRQQALNRSTGCRKNPELVQWLCRLHNQRVSYRDLALVTGISRDTLRRWCSADARHDPSG